MKYDWKFFKLMIYNILQHPPSYHCDDRSPDEDKIYITTALVGR